MPRYQVIPTKVAAGLTDAQKLALALSLNVDRRQLTREQRRELIAASLKAEPELSDRQHAQRTGTHHVTVGDVRRDLESTGQIVQSDTRVSADGRERPATQPDRPTPELVPDDDVIYEDDSPDSPDEWLDPAADDDDPALTAEECEQLADPDDWLIRQQP